MPLRDGTGPAGLGPMTGRGLGYCTGFSGRIVKRFGRGFGGLCIIAGLAGLGALWLVKKLNA